jgi:hypothetical protein
MYNLFHIHSRPRNISSYKLSIIQYIEYFQNAFIKYKTLLKYCSNCLYWHPRFVVIGKCMAYKLSLLISECAHVKLFFTCIISILVCKSLNGKTCQHSNNTFQKRQKELLVLQSYILKKYVGHK